MAPPGHEDGAEFVVVRILTDAGIEGVGEASGTPRWSGETVWGTKAMIDHILAPRLIGADPGDIVDVDRRMDRVCKHNGFTKAAIEMACWDIQGKALGKPIYALLGGGERKRTIVSRFSIGGYPAPEAAALAAEAVSQGFRTVRVKVGGVPADDIARVRAVRDAIGPGCALVIDAVGGWDADTALACLRTLEACEIAWVEQPTVAGDYTALARVKAQCGRRVVADDGCFSDVEARELILHSCCDAISLYPGKNGGIRKAREIADLLHSHGLICTIGSNGESDVGTSAAGHLCLSSQAFDLERLPGDLRAPEALEFPIVTNPLAIVGPMTTVPATPGLGVDIDWAAVRANPARRIDR